MLCTWDSKDLLLHPLSLDHNQRLNITINPKPIALKQLFIMRPTLVLLALASLAFGNLIPKDQNGCNADNCARAVTGTRDGPATVYEHQQDCKSFMQVTEHKQ
jgi:hypothetical protein